MRYTIKELKARIDGQAESIIANGLGLTRNGGSYTGQCPHGGHTKNNPSYEWKGDHFFCYDCHRHYDIVDYLRAQSNEWLDELHKLAGVDFEKRKLKSIKPRTLKLCSDGESYLKTRGISRETMLKYKVRSDNQWIYFNYFTPEKELVGTKWRSIQGKRFQNTKGGESVLYGMHLMKEQKVLIICEGEIDALSMSEIISKSEHADNFLCSSLPQGAGSLAKVMENCEYWLQLFEQIIIVPDRDEAGDKFKEIATELLGEYELYCVDLPCNDVNEYMLSSSYVDKEILSKPQRLLPELSFSIGADEQGDKIEYKAYESGFITLDNNYAGLQEGWLTVLSGRRNDGKTTFTRQILLALAMQGIKSYMFVGEGRWETDRDKLARLAYGGTGGSNLRKGTIGGAKRWDATDESVEQFRKEYGKFIRMSDMTQLKDKSAYDEMFSEMKKLVRHGFKVFVIDSLMKMTLKPPRGMNKWQMQEKVIDDLKTFADTQRVHIILIAHTNKGGVQTSGVEEISNMADGILMFHRLTKEEDKPTITIPPQIKDRVSSYITIEKARDDGGYNPVYMEWDAKRGGLINLSSQIEADEYEKRGYWTKYIHRYSEQDTPDYDKQYSGK